MTRAITHIPEREEALRSRKVAGVRRELWGVFLTYNLIRRKMEMIASEAGRRVNAHQSYCVNAKHCARSRAPGTIPKRLQQLRANVKKFILPKRRWAERVYPRAVKVKNERISQKTAQDSDITGLLMLGATHRQDVKP